MHSVTVLSTALTSCNILKIVRLAEVVFSCQMYSLCLLQNVFPLFCALLNFDSYLLVISKTHTLTLILPRSRTGTVWFYTSTSNKRAARPKL